MKSQFSPQGYSDLLEALLAADYVARDYSNAEPDKRHLIVRHDVDFSLDAAETMAVTEKSLNVASTYFVLMRTEFYNLLSKAGLASLRNIVTLGHDIGLHFDMSLYPDEGEHADAIERECNVLQDWLDRPITVISLHRPSANRVGENNKIAGRLNAYGPRFIKDMGYCSDSQGAWRFGEPLDHPAVQEGRALQLLTHPFWWQSPVLTPDQRLRRFLTERTAFLDKELERNCLIHKAANVSE